MADAIDYAAIIADLEMKKAAIEGSLASLRAASASGALGQGGDYSGVSGAPATSSTPMELPKNAFVGKSIPAAVTLYLTAIKRKQTSAEIAAGLQEGGAVSTAKNFENVVNGALYRLKDNEKVVRFKDGWILSEYVHGLLRSVVSKGETKRKRKSGRKRQAMKDHTESKEKTKAGGSGVEGRIESLLNEDEFKTFSLAEVATKVGSPNVIVAPALGRMISKGKVIKLPDGKYKYKVA